MSEAAVLEKENLELKNWIASYLANEKLAQSKIAVKSLATIYNFLQLYVYEHQLEQELLQNDILKLNEQILRAKNELAMFDTKDASGDIEWDEGGDIKGASVEKLTDFLYYDHGTSKKIPFHSNHQE
jgi:hypothetical protein